jgi:hypothetical protein
LLCRLWMSCSSMTFHWDISVIYVLFHFAGNGKIRSTSSFLELCGLKFSWGDQTQMDATKTPSWAKLGQLDQLQTPGKFNAMACRGHFLRFDFSEFCLFGAWVERLWSLQVVLQHLHQWTLFQWRHGRFMLTCCCARVDCTAMNNLMQANKLTTVKLVFVCASTLDLWYTTVFIDYYPGCLWLCSDPRCFLSCNIWRAQ